MTENDPAVRDAITLLQLQLVDHDEAGVKQLLDQLDDLHRTHYVLAAVLEIVDHIMGGPTAVREQALSRVSAAFLPDHPGNLLGANP